MELGDGLVIYRPPDKADLCMRIFNADCLEARMCGNASRWTENIFFDYGLTLLQNRIALDTSAHDAKPALGRRKGQLL